METICRTSLICTRSAGNAVSIMPASTPRGGTITAHAAPCARSAAGQNLKSMPGNRAFQPWRKKGKATVSAVINHFFHSLKNILTDRRIVVTSNMEGVQNLSVGALEAFMPIYIVMILGYSEFQAGLIWGVQIFITILAKPLMGKISDKHGRRQLLFWGMFVCAVPFAVVPWVKDYSILLLLSTVFGLGEAIVTSSSAAMVADFCREDNIGSAMGVFGTLYDIGHATGPILAGLLIGLSDGRDFRLAFAIIASILVISALFFRRTIPAFSENHGAI